MSVKSFSEFNHDRFDAESKKRRLKENKAKRASQKQRLRDINLDEDYDDDFEAMEKFRNRS
jgi:hypothetical protein